MVAYIRSDLDFILAQIKIAEAHAAGEPLYGPGGLIPTYNLAWGLRTVDGSYNNLLHPTWGSADQEFPEPLGTEFRPAAGTPLDMDGPGPAPPMSTQATYAPSNNPGSIVVDSSVRTISNLLVDQTLGNPAAILTALQRAGIDPELQMVRMLEISAAYAPVRPLFEDLGDAERAFANASAAAAASPGNEALQAAAAAAQQVVADAQAALDAVSAPLLLLLDQNGIVLEGANISLPNIAPDEGLSAPFNSWFTLFGQFFDHGLDLVNKGGSGTVFIPLTADDPLYDPTSPTNFMVLTRATVGPGPDNLMGTADDTRPVNTTTAFVDQNQTYTSHSSHQVFLRAYEYRGGFADGPDADLLPDSHPVSTGRLIEGDNGGMATWADVKEQARSLLGIQLIDSDVGNIPLLATDQYGNFIPGPNGFPQMVFPGATPGTFVLVEGNPLANNGLGVLTEGAIRTGHAFLADIAHSAVPTGLADGDIEIGLSNPDNSPTNGQYDNELLDAHFIAGDGRANENIGLTAVHHVFHSEHNRLVEHTKAVALADARAMLAGGATEAQAVLFLNEWLDVDVATVPTALQEASLTWDGERLFQAAKFGTEMQYQHLVFEEFARKIQPNINVFLVPDGYDVTINPDIVAEFAHVVYRFGHSMLTETIGRFDPTFTDHDIGLIEGFLNPIQFLNNGTNDIVDAGISAGAIIRGMTRQEGNQIDEFVTSALRNNLLGLPLDLATINLARGRDTGVPSLNATRREFYEATNEESLLRPYESWVDFAGHLKNEASIINFIAAYGTHSLITGETTVEGKRDAALTLITGVATGKFATLSGFEVPTDAVDFLNGLGAYGAAGALGGLENVDLWIGGLAEETMPFGGMLGSTFNFVFETQMERLQNGDRFYYLQRLDGLHLFSEMEGNSFASLIMRNTDATHLPSDVFSTPGLILEVDRTKQYNPGLGEVDGLSGNGLLDNPATLDVNEAADNLGNDPTGGGILTPLVIRNNPATPGPDTNYLRYTGDEHVVLGGTEGADILIASIGDDTLFGDGGNDRLEGGFGNDIINGGAGDDIIRDAGGDDNIKGGDGNDVVNAGNGLDLVLGGAGQDFVVLGTDMGSEVFGGEGNDFILGNKNAERLLGNEGDDWLETGTFDGAPGDNFDEIFARDSIRGNDVFLGDGGFDEFIGEGGDDIFVGSPGRGKMAGMSGFDWATYKDNVQGVNADLSIPIIFDEAPTLPQNAALDEFESVNGLSGTRFNDILAGSNEDATTLAPLSAGGSTGFLGSGLDAQGIALVTELQAVLGAGVTSFAAGDIILGGDGSDVIQGNAGDDIIDGDKWLDVQIGVFAVGDTNHTGTPISLHNSMTSLAAAMFNGEINPGQLSIVRTIRTDTTLGDIDTAKYQGGRGEYAFSATADGQVIVTHAIEDQLDGSDRLRNIEKVQFATGNALNIIVGTAGNDVPLNGTGDDDLILGLAGADTLNGLAGNDILVGGPGGDAATFIDNFGSQNYNNNNGSANFAGNWIESGGEAGGATGGDIDINGNRLRFNQNVDGGEIIQRSINLAGATAATLSFAYEDDDLGAGQSVIVEAFNVVTNLWETLTGGTLGSTTLNGPNTFTIALTANQIGATSAIRFRTTGDGNNWDNGDNFYVDNVTITATIPGLNAGVDTLNGGLGDDTYSFSLGDGNDVINEAANGGSADRISILAPSTGTDIDGLPILTINSLNAFDNDGGTNNGDLVINYSLPSGATPVAQTITVVNHFDGTDSQTGVERINFNGATYAGYLLGVDDYLISRLDPNNRDGGGVNLTASTANNFIVGENGTADEITGGSGNDLIFGGTGTNDLVGGLGDDLLVGGTGNDDLDARTNGDADNLDLVGALGADTMIGGAGNDTYGVDDLLDVVVEAAGEGTDTVETFMAALSIELMANVENLSYEGGDADQFVGTGNAGANEITGGDLNDTLSGLGGNDELNGGLGNDTLDGGEGDDDLFGGDDNDILVGGIGADELDGGDGADNMTGGDGNDIFEVNDAGDVVVEAAGATSGTDRVDSSVSFVLGANVENLTLTGGDAINGTGNALANIITGNGGNNQLFGGALNDTIDGGNGNDLIDGGTGDDTLSGGTGGDTDNIIGGAGNDTINLVTTGNDGGNDVVIYNAAGFGNDIITNFDATGGTATTQDRIDLSALGITAANLATRVIESTVGGNTLLTVRDASLATIGTIQVNGVTNANIDATDYILAAAAPAPFGAATAAANTITGNAGANLIDGLGGNDTLSGAGGDDVIIGGEGTDILNGDDGNDTLRGGAGSDSGTYADNFGATSYANSNGTVVWTGSWTESGGEATSPTGGDIAINGGRLQFNQNIDGGEIIQRSINLTGATAATLSFAYEDDNLGAGQSVIVEAFNVVTNAWETLTGGTLGSTTGNGNGNFTATLSANQIGANSAIRFRTTGDGNNWDNGDNFYVDNLTVSFTAAGLNAGADTVNGGAGDDTIIWNANTTAPTDGRDMVNGGTEGAGGDMFVVNGNASEEWYRIYTKAAAATAGIASAAATEIVITRALAEAGPFEVIAELSEIEEIRLNSVDPAGSPGVAGGDHFEIIGDFSGTSLRPNTITIDGDAGNDTVDISSLGSAHRIVFRSNGGNDTIIGTLRPQDVIELPDGATAADYTTTTDANGVSTMTNGTHSVTFTAPGGMPQVGDDDEEEDEDDDNTGHDDDNDDCGGDDDATTGGPMPPASAVGVVRTGAPSADVLTGTLGPDNIIAFAGDDVVTGEDGADAISAGEGADFVSGGDGRDVIFAGAGDDQVLGGGQADVIYGDAGADRIFGDGGNDLINAGAGDDAVFGGAGDDLIVAEVGDGSDVYFGDDSDGGTGVDTLDMSAVSANVSVNLGSGALSNGTASSSQTGNDTIWGIENVNTGSGNDTITASNAVNVMNGGAGDDTFKFTSTSAANGDTIVTFEPGDRIDLTGIDANIGTAGDQSFTLVTGAPTAAGQLGVTFETRADGDFTVVQGNIDGNADADFTIEIAGHQNLTNANVGL